MDLGEQYSEEHVPEGLWMMSHHARTTGDERGFIMHDEGLPYFERKLANDVRKFGIGTKAMTLLEGKYGYRILPELIAALGRVPTPAEVVREERRQGLHEQAHYDSWIDMGGRYFRAEVKPQRSVIERRKDDFPPNPNEFATAPAEIREIMADTRSGMQQETQLVLTTTNRKGGLTEHPVMTTAELPWVRAEADAMAMHARGGRVFIAGLGLGLLNEELDHRGVAEQVVAELNVNVIKLKEKPLQNSMKGKLEVRQGDFKEVLAKAVECGEQFDAILVDAFPNAPEEVNRDAFNPEILDLALKALKPGGMLTFYADSRYIPDRILSVLHEAGVPNSCIHYTVAQFQVSDFTERYHYGKLMAVPCIIKPKMTDPDGINRCMEEFDKTQAQWLRHNAEKYPPEETAEIKAA